VLEGGCAFLELPHLSSGAHRKKCAPQCAPERPLRTCARSSLPCGISREAVPPRPPECTPEPARTVSGRACGSALRRLRTFCAGLAATVREQKSISEFARGGSSEKKPLLIYRVHRARHSPCRRAHVWQWQWRASRRGFWARLARGSHATVTQRPRRCEDGICCGIAPAVPRLPLHMAVNAQFRAHHPQVL